MTAAPDTPGITAGAQRRIWFVRLRANAPRHLATSAMLILVALGIRSLLWPPAPAEPAPPARQASSPSRDFALRFARAYLSYDARRPALRERALAPFLGDQHDDAAGFFASAGSRRVLWAQVASDQRGLAGGGRVITVAAGVSTQSAPLYLAVGVRHDPRRGVSLVGYPALVGAPAVDASAAQPRLVPVEDATVATVAERALRNYLARSPANLQADLDPRAVISLPSLRLTLREIDSLGWIGAADSGAVQVTVVAEDPAGATYTLSYELGVERRARPYVSFIQVIPTAT